MTLTKFLIGLILVTCTLIALRLSRVATFFAQPDAHSYVWKLLAIFILYAGVVLWAGRKGGTQWNSIRKTAFSFGLVTGVFEILSVAVENGLPVAQKSKLFPIAATLGIFAIWGVAGFQSTRRLNSIQAGLLTAIGSAMVCMLIGVTGGVTIELYLVPSDPGSVSTWAEFKRSGWPDPGACEVANTLDSACSHLLLAPIVAAVFGAVGSALGLFRRPAPHEVAGPI